MSFEAAMKETKLLTALALLCGLTLTVNIYFTIHNKNSLKKIDSSFAHHEKNIQHMVEQTKIHQLSYDSSNPAVAAVFLKDRHFCSLPHEAIAIEIDVQQKKAYYWNHYTKQAKREEAQVYDYEIEKTYIILSSTEQDPPHRMFQIIEINKANQEIIGLAGGVDFYSEWCDSINSKN